MKTKLINFRVSEVEFERIQRVAAATHLPVTDMIRNGLALFMRAITMEGYSADPLEQAFNELLGTGKVIPLNGEERSAVASYKARKAAGKLKTVSAIDVLADLETR